MFSTSDKHPYEESVALKDRMLFLELEKRERQERIRQRELNRSKSSKSKSKSNYHPQRPSSKGSRQMYGELLTERRNNNRNNNCASSTWYDVEEVKTSVKPNVFNGEVSSSGHFKSVALECELRFRESKTAIEMENGGELNAFSPPSTDLIITCCKILGELAPACGPVRRLLSELRVEFARHVFSDFSTPAPGNSTLCKVPYFILAAQLQAQVKDLTEQRNGLTVKALEDSKIKREMESKIKYLQSELEIKEKQLEESNANCEKVGQVAENARDSYNRMREEHEAITKELVKLAKEKQELQTSTQHELYIYQIRLTQLQNELSKAFQELSIANEEIKRLRS